MGVGTAAVRRMTDFSLYNDRGLGYNNASMSGTGPTPVTHRHHTSRVQRGRRTFVAIMIVLASVLVLDTLFGERGVLALVRTRQQHQALVDEVERARAANERLREESGASTKTHRDRGAGAPRSRHDQAWREALHHPRRPIAAAGALRRWIKVLGPRS